MLRINDEVRTLWPRYRVAVIEPGDPRASFPSLVSGSEKRIPEFYELHVQPQERIAGHDADRLLLKARDDSRFDHVIWADHATGLLLRVDVGGRGRTLESSGFSDVDDRRQASPTRGYADCTAPTATTWCDPAIDARPAGGRGLDHAGAMLPGLPGARAACAALDMPGETARPAGQGAAERSGRTASRTCRCSSSRSSRSAIAPRA